MVEYCTTNDLLVINTMYRKTNNKIATYRKEKRPPAENEIEIFSADKHEQLDYIPTHRRWRNSIVNAESDTAANIYSDHLPVIANIHLKLKNVKEAHGKQRPRYSKCSIEENELLNAKMATTLEMNEPSVNSLKDWLIKGHQ